MPKNNEPKMFSNNESFRNKLSSRQFLNVLFIGVAGFIVVAFMYWWLSPNTIAANDSADGDAGVEILDALIPYGDENEKEEEENKALEAITGGEDNPINIKNVDYIEDMNIPKSFTNNMTRDVKSPSAIAKALTGNSEPDKGNQKIKGSLFNMLDADIKSSDNRHAGKLKDVLINKNTGEIQAIIIKEDGSYIDQQMKALSFDDFTESQGNVKIPITEKDLERKQIFDYNGFKSDEFISLAILKNAPVFDDTGKLAGRISAISESRDAVEEITFTLSAKLNPVDRPLTFSLPYTDLKIIKKAEQAGIQLSNEQTKALAEILYQ